MKPDDGANGPDGGGIGAGLKGSVLAERAAQRGARARRPLLAPPERFPTNEEVVKAVQGRVEVRRGGDGAAAIAAKARDCAWRDLACEKGAAAALCDLPAPRLMLAPAPAPHRRPSTCAATTATRCCTCCLSAST